MTKRKASEGYHVFIFFKLYRPIWKYFWKVIGIRDHFWTIIKWLLWVIKDNYR